MKFRSDEQGGAPEGETGIAEPKPKGGGSEIEDGSTEHIVGQAKTADAPEPRRVPDDLLDALVVWEATHAGLFDAACAEHGIDSLELSSVEDIPEEKREAV